MLLTSNQPVLNAHFSKYQLVGMKWNFCNMKAEGENVNDSMKMSNKEK